MRLNHNGGPYLLSWACALRIAYAQDDGGFNPYAPVYTDCPDSLTVRDPSDGLSSQESDWWDTRSERIVPALRSYLELANISGLDVGQFVDNLDPRDAPRVGLSISGGGTQSGIGGLGIWRAFDARESTAREARTGGIVQILSYLTGLSGGGAVTVGIISANNFSTVEDIRQAVNFSLNYEAGENSSTFFETIFENTGAKEEAGFPVSVADPFGQFWSNWLPEDWIYANWTTIADEDGAFAMGEAPMPILVYSEVIPDESPNIGGIMIPGRNDTNGFDLTLYEVTPFEFGNWLGGRVQAFFPTEWLGTAMSNGSAVNSSGCALGFDKFTFMQGTTTNAFNAWLIDSFYNIPIFAKRGLDVRQTETIDDIPIPSDQADNIDVLLINQTASEFNLTFNESLWSTYPNPFMDYNDAMAGVSELLLIDGSLTGETNPIRPLIIPDRAIDFIIVYEASSDSTNDWVNGTNLINTAQSASDGDIPFPQIPDVNTMVALNLTRKPSFFGCNDTDVPLVLYLPNSPWSGYSNFTFFKSSFTDDELDLTIENAFQLATYGNSSMDSEWPACLACAVIRGALNRTETDVPEQCTQCYERHCWNGTTSDVEATAADFDLRPMLNSSLSFEEWNTTIWPAENSDSGGYGSGSSSGSDSDPGSDSGSGGDEDDLAGSWMKEQGLSLSIVVALVASLVLTV